MTKSQQSTRRDANTPPSCETPPFRPAGRTIRFAQNNEQIAVLDVASPAQDQTAAGAGDKKVCGLVVAASCLNSASCLEMPRVGTEGTT